MKMLHVLMNLLTFVFSYTIMHSKTKNILMARGWLVRVCLVPTNDEKDFYLPVFIFVLTKFKKMTNSKAVCFN